MNRFRLLLGCVALGGPVLRATDSAKFAANGYTNLENYLNSLVE